MIHEYTALFPFGGLGAGARGFLDAEVSAFGGRARFRSLGGIDLDAAACADFQTLTGSPALCADVAALTPADVRAAFGERAPDVVFSSPPCKGLSGLLSKAAAASPRYEAMNQLALVWVRLMLAAWPTSPPRLVLIENVPRIASRGASLLREVKRLLRAAGYAFHAGTHDCGELGGLAQHRRRFLLVARHERSVPPLLYQPPKKRVRACGEVLGRLPLPGDPAAGPMHALPRLSWLNLLRLALIPAGGDWRDLPGVLELEQPRREVFRRHHVARWTEPLATVAGSGSNGPSAVADPRAPWAVSTAYDHGYGVLSWREPSSTVAGGSHPGQGAYSVADPRGRGVMGWREAAELVARMSPAEARKAPDVAPVIIAADGTWHRPLTTLELAALQGLPTEVDGRPLALAGKSSSAWRERIGNAVPVGAARAIAEQMLVTLRSADAESFALSSAGGVWVERAIGGAA